jgi:hypothetical protein
VRALSLATLTVSLTGCALGLSACGGFDSAKSGQHVISDFAREFGPTDKFSLKSVSCPSGVAQKAGQSYTCNVVLRQTKTGKDLTGTATIHMLSGNKLAIDGARDVHVR